MHEWQIKKSIALMVYSIGLTLAAIRAIETARGLARAWVDTGQASDSPHPLAAVAPKNLGCRVWLERLASTVVLVLFVPVYEFVQGEQ